MAKKMDRGEPKKECPSCGLGVSLEANICEFCGWDFEEEDEWILQIEKLERELMLEKQKFEPGTVNHKIESTLRSPVLERAEAAQIAAHAPLAEERDEPVVAYTADDLIERKAPPAKKPPEPRAERPAPGPSPEPAKAAPGEPVAAKTRKVRSVKAPAPVHAPALKHEPKSEPAPPEPAKAPAPQTRRVKAAAPEPMDQPVKKVRTVRKVKG
jgi:hypothetical protein